jgi:tetratricopeptide (TPR) repeat protein
LGTYLARVADTYSIPTLCRILLIGDAQARRAVVLAIGWIAGAETQGAIGRALRDRDRGVRLLAMSLLPEIWQRAAGSEARNDLARIRRWNCCGRYLDAEKAALDLLAQFPHLDEAEWQLAMSRLGRNDEAAALRSFRTILARNRYYFPAAAELGRCLSRQKSTIDAIAALRLALRICPELESVRLQLRKLEHERRP